MKTLTQFILEELDDNLFWKLSKWFDSNEAQEKEFMDILFASKESNFNVKEIESFLENTSLYDNLREFVNFIIDDLDISKDKDYLYQFKQILKMVSDNKSNKYNK
jgi:hypothetical protein